MNEGILRVHILYGLAIRGRGFAARGLLGRRSLQARGLLGHRSLHLEGGRLRHRLHHLHRHRVHRCWKARCWGKEERAGADRTKLVTEAYLKQPCTHCITTARGYVGSYPSAFQYARSYHSAFGSNPAAFGSHISALQI